MKHSTIHKILHVYVYLQRRNLHRVLLPFFLWFQSHVRTADVCTTHAHTWPLWILVPLHSEPTLLSCRIHFSTTKKGKVIRCKLRYYMYQENNFSRAWPVLWPSLNDFEIRNLPDQPKDTAFWLVHPSPGTSALYWLDPVSYYCQWFLCQTCETV